VATAEGGPGLRGTGKRDAERRGRKDLMVKKRKVIPTAIALVVAAVLGILFWRRRRSY